MNEETIHGKVVSEPSINQGRLTFCLLEDGRGIRTSCMAGFDFTKQVRPKKGDRVSLVGGIQSNLIGGDQLPYVLFSYLEIKKPNKDTDVTSPGRAR